MLMDGHTKTPDTEMVETDDLKHVLILLEKMEAMRVTPCRTSLPAGGFSGA